MSKPSESESVVHIRADRSPWDFHNLLVVPFQELNHYRELIRNIVSRDLKVRYKRSALGIAWTVVAPLAQMLVIWLVFTMAFKIQIPYYAVYLFAGITTWNFFLQSIVSGSQSIMNAAGLITKVRLPRVIFPLTAAVNNLVNFCFAFIALVLLMIVTGAPFHATLLLMPVMILPLAIFCAGCSMLVSALSVFFRDLQYILEVSMNALFYASPILWDASQVPERYHWVLSVNPMAKYIFFVRSSVYYGSLPELRTYLIGLGISLAFFGVGWVVFHRLQRRFIYWL